MHVDHVLDPERDSPEATPVPSFRLQGLRLRECAFSIEVDPGIQVSLALIDPLEAVLE